MPITEYKANDIELDSVLLYNSKRNFIDINKIMVEFNIYHDLFDKATLCDVFINDANALVDLFPIVGDETLVIVFRTPTFKKRLTYVFRIYKITDREVVEQRSEGYVLHGISQESIADLRKSVNRSYVDLKGHQIVEGIYNDFLRPTEEEFGVVKKNIGLNLQETLQNHSIVFPGEKPFDAIDYVCYEAFPEVQTQVSESPNFIFFQREDGWYFNTIDSLIEADPVEDFFYAPANSEETSKSSKIHDHQKISTMDILSQLDTIDNLKHGLYAHKVETIDPIMKRFTTDTFVYSREMNEIAHLEKSKKDFGSEFLISQDSFFNSDADTSKKYYTIGHIGENYSSQKELVGSGVTDPQIRNPRRMHERLKYNVASRFQLSNIEVSITIPGNSDIHVGQIVNLHIPLATENADFAKKLKLLWDKKFLVTALRHTYQKSDNVFFTVLECVKDTYAKKTVEVK